VKLHLIALPHAHVSRDVTVCAFTTKIAKFLKMMAPRGWEIVLYGGERSEVGELAELVSLYSNDEQIGWFGNLHPNDLPLIAGSWDSRTPQFATTNLRAIDALKDRYEQGDLILVTGGLAQKPITDILGSGYLACEWAAGYSGWYLPFVCFESYAWKHWCYGRFGVDDGRWFDTVIPNFFDPDEWPEPSEEKENYLLFVGRLIARKGPHVAAQIARELGMPLVVAGSGMAETGDGFIRCQDGTMIEGEVHYAGTVGWEERHSLMSRARALIAPTTYIEPFGAVVVESMLAGTPSIATDWGAFSEILPRERRFTTLAEGCEAVEKAMALPPAGVRIEALSRYSLKAVAPLYEEWFARLETLYRGGWYEPRPASPESEKIPT
jgi:glycosyltransferase involved in cell wall biosynthesis